MARPKADADLGPETRWLGVNDGARLDQALDRIEGLERRMAAMEAARDAAERRTRRPSDGERRRATASDGGKQQRVNRWLVRRLRDTQRVLLGWLYGSGDRDLAEELERSWFGEEPMGDTRAASARGPEAACDDTEARNAAV